MFESPDNFSGAERQLSNSNPLVLDKLVFLSLLFSYAGPGFVQFCIKVQGGKRTGLFVPCEVYNHNTANFMPYSSRIVCEFLNVPH